MSPHGDGTDQVSLDSSDVDETRHVLARYFYANFVDLLDPRVPLAARLTVTRLGPLTLGDVRFGTDLRMWLGELGAYHVDVPLSGQLLWRQGGSDVLRATPSNALVCQPVGDTRLERFPVDGHVLALKIDRHALESQLGRMMEAPIRSPIRLGREFDLSHGRGRTWAGLVRLLAADAADATGGGGLARHPLVGARLQEALLTVLLLTVDHPYRDRLDDAVPPAPAPRSVRRAMDVMQAHPEWPFTVAQLAEIADVSQRSLQRGFQRHVGLSPLAYLSQVRLARVHQERAAPIRPGSPSPRSPTAGGSSIWAGSPARTAAAMASHRRRPCARPGPDGAAIVQRCR